MKETGKGKEELNRKGEGQGGWEGKKGEMKGGGKKTRDEVEKEKRRRRQEEERRS